MLLLQPKRNVRIEILVNNELEATSKNVGRLQTIRQSYLHPAQIQTIPYNLPIHEQSTCNEMVKDPLKRDNSSRDNLMFNNSLPTRVESIHNNIIANSFVATQNEILSTKYRYQACI